MRIRKCECGAKPELFCGDMTRGYEVFVKCPSCKREGPPARPELPIVIDIFLKFAKGYGRDLAIEKWNDHPNMCKIPVLPVGYIEKHEATFSISIGDPRREESE